MMRAIILLALAVSAQAWSLNTITTGRRDHPAVQATKPREVKREIETPKGFRMFLPNEMRDPLPANDHRVLPVEYDAKMAQRSVRNAPQPERFRMFLPGQKMQDALEADAQQMLPQADEAQALQPKGFRMFFPGEKIPNAPEIDAQQMLPQADEEDNMNQAIRNAPQAKGFRMLLPGQKMQDALEADAQQMLPQADEAQALQPKGFRMFLPGEKLPNAPEIDGHQMLPQAEEKDNMNQAIRNAPQAKGFRMLLPGGRAVDAPETNAHQGHPKKEDDMAERTIRSAPQPGGFQMLLPGNKAKMTKPLKRNDLFSSFPLADEAWNPSRAKREALSPDGIPGYFFEQDMGKIMPGAVPFLPKSNGPRRRRRTRSVTQNEAIQDSGLSDLPDLSLEVYQEVNEGCGCGCGSSSCNCSDNP